MARLDSMTPALRKHYVDMACPKFDGSPWVVGPPLARRKVALISTAGLHRRTDRPFALRAGDYRLIPEDTPSADLVMSHMSTNYDRTGFQQDWNVVFPLDRLREMCASGDIGSLARHHYSFMGATDVLALSRRPATWRGSCATRASMPPCWFLSDPTARVPWARSATTLHRVQEES